MEITTRVILAALLAATAMAGCGGGGDSQPAASSSSQTGLQVTTFSYPNETFQIGKRYELLPTVDAGGCVPANTPLRFEVAAGPLPSGLALDAGSGRISGTVGPAMGNYPVTIRLSGLCASGPITTSAFFTVI